MSSPEIGATISTTVHGIGGRSERVSGGVIGYGNSRRTGAIVSVRLDCSEAGYGTLSIELAKIER